MRTKLALIPFFFRPYYRQVSSRVKGRELTYKSHILTRSVVVALVLAAYENGRGVIPHRSGTPKGLRLILSGESP